jgi:N-acetylneuraminic acid mutarotase
VLGIGGQREQGASAEVFLLRWDGATQRVERSVLPDLPEAAASAAAVEFDGAVYVAGGMNERATLRNFWRLDLAKAVARPTATPWERLPAWPGVARFGGELSVIAGVAGPRLMLTGGIAGPARGAEDYLRETWLYDPREGLWSSGATMPRGAVLGVAIAWMPSHAIILGGSDGHDFHRMRELGDRYRIPSDILVYDAVADRWSRDGTMPMGVVGATAIKLEESWLMAGGEPSPGLRTPHVYEFRRGAR